MMDDTMYLGRKVWAVKTASGHYFRPGKNPTNLLNEAQLYSQDMAIFLAGEDVGAIVPCRQVVLTDKDTLLLLDSLEGVPSFWAIALDDGYYFRPGKEATRVLGEAMLYSKQDAVALAQGLQGEAVPCRQVVLTEEDARSRLPLDRPPAAKEAIAAEAVEPPVPKPATTTTRRRRSS